MRILITGGTGYLGRALTQRLREDHTVATLSRDEHKILDADIIIHVGNIEHLEDIRRAIHRFEPELVIHAAALKVVPQSEVQPFEYIRTNVLGTWNLLQALPPETPVLLVSTDKAVAPFNVYGATKMLAERLVVRHYGGAVVRFGNIFGSTGSVLTIWMHQVAYGKPITVTDPSMTRFFITRDQAVDFILDHLTRPGIWVPVLPAHTLGDLVEAVRAVVDPPPDVISIPVRRGEKFHEVLVSRDELHHAVRLGDEVLITPNVGGNLDEPLASNTAERLPREDLQAAVRDFVERWCA